MHIPSHGGNAMAAQGQLTLSGASQQIPFPTAVLDTQLQMMKLTITHAATHPVFVQSSSPAATTTGALVPANVAYVLTAARPGAWVIGTAADVITFSWEWN